MSFSIKYKPVFEVQILHDFYLNKGNQQFNAMTDAEKKRRLNSYNLSRFIQVYPNTETQQKINGRQLVFRTSATGFSVWSKVNDLFVPEIELEDDLSFTFILAATDPMFLNYSAINLSDSERLYYLSNKKSSGELASFPLIQLAGSNIKISGDYYLNPENQVSELKALKGSLRPLALIRLFLKGDLPQLNITERSGALKNPAPVFSIQFENRKTIWRYIFSTNQVVKPADDLKKFNGSSTVLISKTEHPLTETGFIQVELNNRELPNPVVSSLKPDLIQNKYYSEIYM